MRTPDLMGQKDSRVFQVNRLQAYSDHIYTIEKDKQPSSFSLNGTWKFNVSKTMIPPLNSFIILNLTIQTGTTSKHQDTSSCKVLINPTTPM